MGISSYCSVGYLGIFLPIVVILYSITPKKYRWAPLLIASYVFFWLISGPLVVYLIFTTVCIYLTGLWLAGSKAKCDAITGGQSVSDRKKTANLFIKKQKAVLTLVIVVHILLLAVLKYSKFFAGNINGVLALMDSPLSLSVPKIAAPIGISFYSLQAISYICDVYRNKIPADRNFARVALFMSFFPQIMEGPICRYSDTAQQLYRGDSIKFENLTFGIQRILFGLLKKIVIADRLNAFVETTFGHYGEYSGTVSAIAAIAFTLQLYMEFSGTMDMVIGSAQIFSVKMPENFRQPFFSKTISEFWQRWHITLGTWFKDYIYYPVSMSPFSKKLTKKSRKKLGHFYGPMLVSTIALFCVWFCNGMWHGSGWRYIFFGMYHFVLITCGNLIKPAVKTINGKLGVSPSSPAYKGMQIFRTSILVCIGELFFRANGLRAGFAMSKLIVTDFSFETFTDGTLLKLGLDIQDYVIIIVTTTIVFTISVISEKGKDPRVLLAQKKLPVRWIIIFALIFWIIIFGAYGSGYVPVDPIYADF